LGGHGRLHLGEFGEAVHEIMIRAGRVSSRIIFLVGALAG